MSDSTNHLSRQLSETNPLRRRDPLLLITGIASVVGMAIAASVALVSFVAATVVWVIRDRISAEIMKAHAAAFVTPGQISWRLLMVTITAVLVLLFLRQLQQVITSVAKGSPFHPQNARRLTRMAVLSATASIFSMVVGGVGYWAAIMTKCQPGIVPCGSSIKDGIDLGGWLLALVLLVLARVFRAGTNMRVELEGVV